MTEPRSADGEETANQAAASPRRSTGPKPLALGDPGYDPLDPIESNATIYAQSPGTLVVQDPDNPSRTSRINYTIVEETSTPP